MELEQMKELLKRELHYFIDHQDELVKRYNGTYIVLKDGKVLGSYPTSGDALYYTEKEHEVGTFLIQRCIPGKGAYTINYSGATPPPMAYVATDPM